MVHSEAAAVNSALVTLNRKKMKFHWGVRGVFVDSFKETFYCVEAAAVNLTIGSTQPQEDGPCSQPLDTTGQFWGILQCNKIKIQQHIYIVCKLCKQVLGHPWI